MDNVLDIEERIILNHLIKIDRYEGAQVIEDAISRLERFSEYDDFRSAKEYLIKLLLDLGDYEV